MELKAIIENPLIEPEKIVTVEETQVDLCHISRIGKTTANQKCLSSVRSHQKPCQKIIKTITNKSRRININSTVTSTKSSQNGSFAYNRYLTICIYSITLYDKVNISRSEYTTKLYGSLNIYSLSDKKNRSKYQLEKSCLAPKLH